MTPLALEYSSKGRWGFSSNRSVTRIFLRPSRRHCAVLKGSMVNLGRNMMSSARTLSYAVGVRPMSGDATVVFIVDDDISVRESLELLVRTANWRPEAFASA